MSNSSSGLTGKTRYRHYSRMFRKPIVVLQVEYNYSYVDAYDLMSERITTWRDATIDDLFDLEWLTTKGDAS